MDGNNIKYGGRHMIKWLGMKYKLFKTKEDGVGVVEVILILVVLIGLVAIFKSQLTSVMNSILSKISSQAGNI